MKQQFVELTPKEIFFGNAPKFYSAATGALMNTAATSQVIMQPAPIPSFNTSHITQQKIGFVLTDFIWKYRWEIGLGILCGIIIYHSTRDDEEEERKL